MFYTYDIAAVININGLQMISNKENMSVMARNVHLRGEFCRRTSK
jgi:hypothetical protein